MAPYSLCLPPDFRASPKKKGRLIASDSNDHHRVTCHTLESVIYWGQCWRLQRFSIIPTEIKKSLKNQFTMLIV